MADPMSSAREGIQGRQFRSQVLELLERIAIALERQASPILTTENPDLGYPAQDDPKPLPILTHDPTAIVCTCGDDWSKTCSACSGARLARVYREENQQ